MKYVRPNYEAEIVSTNDIILASPISLNGGATLTEKDEENARVGASALDILGLR